MRDDSPWQLLRSDDPDPVAFVNREARSLFLLIGDHAGGAIPAALGTLGLSEADRRRHIALDIGTQALGEALAVLLDATFVFQRFSRLVIDCNRDPARDDAMPAISDGTMIPGNAGLTQKDRRAREREIHAPYHAAIAAEIDQRRQAGRNTILIALHSFTPRLAGGDDRPWEVGVLHNGGEDAFARALLNVLPNCEATRVGDNQPYRMDATDYSVPRHALAPGISYAEIEVRQDLIGDIAGITKWAAHLNRSFSRAASSNIAQRAE